MPIGDLDNCSLLSRVYIRAIIINVPVKPFSRAESGEAEGGPSVRNVHLNKLPTTEMGRQCVERAVPDGERTREMLSTT